MGLFIGGHILYFESNRIARFEEIQQTALILIDTRDHTLDLNKITLILSLESRRILLILGQILYGVQTVDINRDKALFNNPRDYDILGIIERIIPLEQVSFDH